MYSKTKTSLKSLGEFPASGLVNVRQLLLLLRMNCSVEVDLIEKYFACVLMLKPRRDVL